MRILALSAFTASLLFGFAGVVAAQQQKAQPPAMQGMDQSNMQGMKGMEGMKGMDCMDQGSAKATSLTDGEVKNVDPKAGQVTLKHGPIENMKMPPMTMAFPVQDPSVLSSLKEGSKVKFALENVNGVLTITSLVPQK